MDLTPVIRTRSADIPMTYEDVPEGRAMTNQEFEAYLSCGWWRKRRNYALKLAGWRCQDCGSKQRLQVHHCTYERLYQERDSDLRVVCETCHGKNYLGSRRRATPGAIQPLIFDVVKKADRRETFTDLKELAKSACAKARIVYDAEIVGSALEQALARHRKAVM